MTWTARHLPDLDAVETVFAGRVDRDELQAAVAETKRLLLENCGTSLHRVLCDCTTLVAGHSLAELYFVVDEFAADGFAATLREALLVPPGALADNISFWEDACRNRGVSIRVFDDRDLAERWLREQGDSR